MEGKETAGLGLPEIAFEQLRLSPRQVDDDQSVQSLPEVAIDIETNELAAKLQVLAKKHRHPGAPGLDISYCV